VHARNPLDLSNQLAKQAGAPGQLNAAPTQVDPYEQHPFRGEAEVCALQVVDGPRQQPGAHEQGQGQRQLQAHQKPA